jgi:hypothetical protein
MGVGMTQIMFLARGLTTVGNYNPVRQFVSDERTGPKLLLRANAG